MFTIGKAFSLQQYIKFTKEYFGEHAQVQ